MAKAYEDNIKIYNFYEIATAFPKNIITFILISRNYNPYILPADKCVLMDNRLTVNVDFIIGWCNVLSFLAVKSSQTIQADFFKNLKTYKRYAAGQAGIAMLIYGGKDTQKRKDIHVYPWNKIQNSLKKVFLAKAA